MSVQVERNQIVICIAETQPDFANFFAKIQQILILKKSISDFRLFFTNFNHKFCHFVILWHAGMSIAIEINGSLGSRASMLPPSKAR